MPPTGRDVSRSPLTGENSPVLLGVPPAPKDDTPDRGPGPLPSAGLLGLGPVAPPPAVVPRPPSFIETARFGLAACSAGAMPKTTPVSTAIVSVNRSTRTSIATFASGGSRNGGIKSLSPDTMAKPSP